MKVQNAYEAWKESAKDLPKDRVTCEKIFRAAMAGDPGAKDFLGRGLTARALHLLNQASRRGQYLGDPADTISSLVLYMWEHLPQFKPELSALRTFLHLISVQGILLELKRVIKDNQFQRRFTTLEEQSDFVDKNALQEFQKVEDDIDARELRLLIGKLPPREQQSILDYIFNNKTFRQISIEKGLSHEQSRQDVRRGYRFIRQRLKHGTEG